MCLPVLCARQLREREREAGSDTELLERRRRRNEEGEEEEEEEKGDDAERGEQGVKEVKVGGM